MKLFQYKGMLRSFVRAPSVNETLRYLRKCVELGEVI